MVINIPKCVLIAVIFVEQFVENNIIVRFHDKNQEKRAIFTRWAIRIFLREHKTTSNN